MTTTPQLTKAERRAEARIQAEQVKAELAVKERRTRTILWSIIAASIAALGGLGFWLHSHGSGQSAANEAVSFDPIPLAQVEHIPANVNSGGGIVINQTLSASAEENPALPTVAVYLDYMCPACNAFEALNFQALKDMAQNGEANVVMHPIAILDRASLGTAYSTRSAAAAAWVADHSPAAFLRFHELLFERQPGEGTPGLTNAEIAEVARESGADDATVRGIADGTAANTFGQWATSATWEVGTQPNFRGTPTIMLNGEQWDGNWAVAGTLRQAVLDLKG